MNMLMLCQEHFFTTLSQNTNCPHSITEQIVIPLDVQTREFEEE